VAEIYLKEGASDVEDLNEGGEEVARMRGTA
jgi:hypothetical protein